MSKISKHVLQVLADLHNFISGRPMMMTDKEVDELEELLKKAEDICNKGE